MVGVGHFGHRQHRLHILASPKSYGHPHHLPESHALFVWLHKETERPATASGLVPPTWVICRHREQGVAQFLAQAHLSMLSDHADCPGPHPNSPAGQLLNLHALAAI